MKVISVLQPWESLIVHGHKQFETRSWNTKYRGELYIHASSGKKDFRRHLLLDWHHEYDLGGVANYKDLPFGAIIGRVTLIDTCKTPDIILMKNASIPINRLGDNVPANWQKEIAFGDYTPGRYGFLFSNPEYFDKPIPVKGKLGLWDYQL